MLTWVKSLMAKRSGKETTIKEETKTHLLSVKEMSKGMQAVFAESLEPLGFTHMGVTFIRRRCDIAHDEVQIGIRTYGPGSPVFRVDVHIAIISQSVERLLAQLNEESYRERFSMTVGHNLGYVMPCTSYLAWEIPRDHFPEQIARSMVEATIQYGLPYLERLDNWEAIYAETARHRPDNTSHLAVMKYLMDQPEEAVRLLDAELIRLKDATYPATGDFRKFAAVLTALCNSGGKAVS